MRASLKAEWDALEEMAGAVRRGQLPQCRGFRRGPPPSQARLFGTKIPGQGGECPEGKRVRAYAAAEREEVMERLPTARFPHSSKCECSSLARLPRPQHQYGPPGSMPVRPRPPTELPLWPAAGGHGPALATHRNWTWLSCELGWRPHKDQPNVTTNP